MTRRPRAAAPSLAAVWITDDILTEAFNRFVRTSRTNTCRRHGSNIPGPLEAHRRLARRRMGLAAATPSNPPFALDIGAMLGFGTRPPVTADMGWRWEAPSLQTIGPPPLAPAPQVDQDSHKTGDQISSRTTAYGLAGTSIAPTKPAVPIHPVQASQAAFQEQLELHAAKETIEKDTMATLLDFLQSPSDESAACNTLALTQWLLPREMSPLATRLLAGAVCEKVKLQTLSPSQMIPTLALLVQRAPAARIESCLVRILDSLNADGHHAIISEVSTHFRSDTTADRIVTRLWFRVLDACNYMQGMHYDHQTWRRVYQHFARHVAPSLLAHHFGALSHLDLTQILLRYWLPHLEEGELEYSAMDRKRQKLISFRRSTIPETEVQGLIDTFEALRTVKDDYADQVQRFPIVDLMALLATHHRPYAVLLREVFDIATRTKHALSVWGLIRELHRRSEIAIPTQITGLAVKYFIETGDPRDLRRAWIIFKNVPTISVLQCFDLPLKLIEHGYGTPDRIFHMLHRQPGTDLIPPEFREQRRLTLSAAHIDLAHLVAYAWATQPTIRSRVAFRRVWEVYRFLQDRGAPLSVLMSRAMVHAGILRPLKERKYVPLQRTCYIMSLVQRLEGDDIAQSLDRLVFTARSNNTVAKHMPVYNGRLDDGIVKSVKWRLRLWLQRRRPMKVVERNGFVERTDEYVRFDSFSTPRHITPDTEDQELLRREIDKEVLTERAVEGAGAPGEMEEYVRFNPFSAPRHVGSYTEEQESLRRETGKEALAERVVDGADATCEMEEGNEEVEDEWSISEAQQEGYMQRAE